MEPMTDEYERVLLNLYQNFHSLHDDIYPLFERKYSSRLHQMSYRNEDLLQEQKMTLHLTMLAFDIWDKDLSFFVFLCRNTIATLQYINKIHGYQYWSLKNSDREPVHIPLDKNYSSAGSSKGDLKDSSEEIAEALADKHPTIEDTLIMEEEVQLSKEKIKEQSPHYELLLGLARIAAKINRHKRDPEVRKELSDFAIRNKDSIAPESRWHSITKDRSPELMQFVHNEVNRLRVLNGLEPLTHVFNRLAQFQDRDRLKRWHEDWYQAHKEQQRAYYQKYNAHKRKKK